MAQFFRGNLAGLMIRSGKLENKKVIDCLYTCKEGLDVQLPEEVASSIKVRVPAMPPPGVLSCLTAGGSSGCLGVFLKVTYRTTGCDSPLQAFLKIGPAWDRSVHQPIPVDCGKRCSS